MEKKNFCALFDSYYLSRGIVLYRSLVKSGDKFHIYILAMDSDAYDILKKLNLKHATIVKLKDFESDALLRVKKTRNRAEYSWTCASSFLLYVLENYDVDECTYLDSDMKFYGSLKPFFNEFAKDKSVLITPHNYSPLYKALLRNGTYCVQFVSVKKTDEGLEVLKWWADSCIEWCYGRIEDGKFGDQKYLDEFHKRFDCIHDLKHKGILAPWNIQQYEVSPSIDGGFVLLDKKDHVSYPVILYHFHDLKCFENEKIDYGFYKIPEPVKVLYDGYIKELIQADDDIRAISSKAKPLNFASKQTGAKELIKDVLRIVMGAKNTYSLNKFKEKNE